MVGCGYHCGRKEVFFTKNGKFQGTAFSGIARQLDWRASAGSWELGDHIRFNFGGDPLSSPFLFPIYSYLLAPDTFQQSPLPDEKSEEQLMLADSDSDREDSSQTMDD